MAYKNCRDMVTHLLSEGSSEAERMAMLWVASEDSTYKKSLV